MSPEITFALERAMSVLIRRQPIKFPIERVNRGFVVRLRLSQKRTRVGRVDGKRRSLKPLHVPVVMWHSRTATTTDVNMQEVPASVQSTINSINAELRKSDARSRKSSKESPSTAALVRSWRKPSARL